MGWAAGIERILLAGDPMPSVAPAVQLFVALADRDDASRTSAFALLNEARTAGLTASMDLGGRSLKGQLGHAADLGARWVAIVGGKESALRDMQEGGQEPIATDAVVHAVLRAEHAL